MTTPSLVPPAVWDTPDQLAEMIRRGASIADRDFDALYPQSVQRASSEFWTPVRVALRAAELLVAGCGSHVLDVGAGAGKLCIIGSLRTRAHFCGVERRPHLVSLARRTARRLGVSATTRFVHADLDAIRWESFDAFYFYNPFFENLRRSPDRLDNHVELSPERFFRDVSTAYRGLLRARPGARVVTYHGMGCSLPPGYRKQRRENSGTDALELWIRRS